MSEPAISVVDLSKRYRLGSGYGYKTLRESLSGMVRKSEPTEKGFVWALKDVSFDVQPGELVGLIGRNGAGKTTILKVLSRITQPTSGRAQIRGRVGSLLEVGTGFHPELTGRENVFLAGAVLGMRKVDIEQRFDAIADFAEVDDFLDTPTKRYSSGMQVRLAFAVAAHLEPEILIVDEVLAVGDIAFQKKCLNKMSEVTGEGRTVLFVSHNMSLIQSLCRRGILFENGSIAMDAPIDEAVGSYLSALEQVGTGELGDRSDRSGWALVFATHLEISSEFGKARLVTGQPGRIAVRFIGSVAGLSCTLTIFNNLGQPLVTFDSSLAGAEDREDPESSHCFECCIDEVLLVPGRYRLDVTIRGQQHVQDHIEAAAFFDVEPGMVRGRPIAEDAGGDVVMPYHWIRPEAR